MFGRIAKAEETGRFAENVQRELLVNNNTEWKEKIAEYVRDNKNADNVGSTVVYIWSNLSDMLRNQCYYKEALMLGELAVLHSKKLKGLFRDIQIKALLVLGLAQMECMMNDKAAGTLQTAWNLLKPTVKSYESLRMICGLNLAYVYLKSEKYEESQKILDWLKRWITEENPSGVHQEHLFYIYLSEATIMLMQRKDQEGLQFIKQVENDARRVGMKENPVYYKILSLHGLFEKNNNHVAEYYKLTRQAITYARQAGDIQEERAYTANLLDALMRMGKEEEMLLVANEVFADVEELADRIDSLNVLQMHMSVLIKLVQNPSQQDDLEKVIEKVRSAWEKMKAQGINSRSRDSLKVEAQFGVIKLCQKKYDEAEEQLLLCLKQCQEELGEGDIDTLSIQEALAGSRRMQGDMSGALQIYLEIAKLREENGLKNTHSYFETVRSLAYMYYFKGERQEAAKRIFSYFDSIQTYSYEVFSVFDENAWKEFSTEFLITLHDVLGWLAASGTDDMEMEKIYNQVLRFKNRIYDEEMLWKARQEAPILNQKLTEYYNLLKSDASFGVSETGIEFLGKKMLEEEISSYEPGFPGEDMSLASLKENLNDQEAALDYVVYHKTAMKEEEQQEEGYLVFVITKNKTKYYDLGDRKRIDADLADFYQAVSGYNGDSDYLEQQLLLTRAGFGAYWLAENLSGIRKIYLNLEGEWMPRLP